jgi:hypothetical protein
VLCYRDRRRGLGHRRRVGTFIPAPLARVGHTGFWPKMPVSWAQAVFIGELMGDIAVCPTSATDFGDDQGADAQSAARPAGPVRDARQDSCTRPAKVPSVHRHRGRPRKATGVRR